MICSSTKPQYRLPRCPSRAVVDLWKGLWCFVKWDLSVIHILCCVKHCVYINQVQYVSLSKVDIVYYCGFLSTCKKLVGSMLGPDTVSGKESFHAIIWPNWFQWSPKPFGGWGLGRREGFCCKHNVHMLLQYTTMLLLVKVLSFGLNWVDILKVIRWCRFCAK